MRVIRKPETVMGPNSFVVGDCEPTGFAVGGLSGGTGKNIEGGVDVAMVSSAVGFGVGESVVGNLLGDGVGDEVAIIVGDGVGFAVKDFEGA